MLSPIDLQKKFGTAFKVEYEESYRADRGDSARARDPWLMVVLCKHGHIFPYGGDALGASTNRRGAIAKRLAALPCVTVVQDGDDGLNVTFDVENFDEVAAILKPRRRRKLSPEHKAKLVAASRKNLAQHRQSKSDSVDRIRDPEAKPDRKAA